MVMFNTQIRLCLPVSLFTNPSFCDYGLLSEISSFLVEVHSFFLFLTALNISSNGGAGGYDNAFCKPLTAGEVRSFDILSVKVFWVTFRISGMSLKEFPLIFKNLTKFLSCMNVSRYSCNPSVVLTKRNDRTTKNLKFR